MISKNVVAGVLCCVATAFGQLTTSPGELQIFQTIGRSFEITESSGRAVKFRYVGSESPAPSGVPSDPDFVMVVPSEGVTPMRVSILVNPSVANQLIPGRFQRAFLRFTTVGETPESQVTKPVSTFVPQRTPVIESVGNTAWPQQVDIAPGSLVSIYGRDLAGPTQKTAPNGRAAFPTALFGTFVAINGTYAPLRYISPELVQVFVPWALAGSRSAEVIVGRSGRTSPPFTVPVRDVAPAVFLPDRPCGSAGEAGILQPGGEGRLLNSARNPVRSNEAVELYLTGAGVWSQTPESDVYIGGADFRTRPVSVTIGGLPAKVFYQGTGGVERTWSTLQLNVMVPEGVGSGPQPLVVKVGDADNAAQQALVWIQ